MTRIVDRRSFFVKLNFSYFKPSKLTTYPTFLLTKLAGINNEVILIISLLKIFFGDLGTFFSFKPFSEVGFIK